MWTSSTIFLVINMDNASPDPSETQWLLPISCSEAEPVSKPFIKYFWGVPMSWQPWNLPVAQDDLEYDSSRKAQQLFFTGYPVKKCSAQLLHSEQQLRLKWSLPTPDCRKLNAAPVLHCSCFSSLCSPLEGSPQAVH